jgi:hypothetical protein
VLETIQPCSFDWNGSTGIPCSAGPLKKGKELDIGGWQAMQRCKVNVRVASLPDASEYPATNDEIVLYLSDGGTGHRLKILSVENSFDQNLKLECCDPNHDD